MLDAAIDLDRRSCPARAPRLPSEPSHTGGRVPAAEPRAREAESPYECRSLPPGPEDGRAPDGLVHQRHRRVRRRQGRCRDGADRAQRASSPTSSGCSTPRASTRCLVVLAGHGHLGQGRHHQARLQDRQPARACGSPTSSVPNDVELAHDYLWRVHARHPAQRRHHDLQPQPLRGRARRPRARPRARRSVWKRRYDHIRDFEQHARRRGHDHPQVLPAHLEGRAEASACKSGSTTRRSTGSSSTATSRSASTGTTTRRPTRTRRRETSTEDAPWYVVPVGPQVVPQPRDQPSSRDPRGAQHELPEPEPASTRSRSSDPQTTTSEPGVKPVALATGFTPGSTGVEDQPAGWPAARMRSMGPLQFGLNLGILAGAAAWPRPRRPAGEPARGRSDRPARRDPRGSSPCRG